MTAKKLITVSIILWALLFLFGVHLSRLKPLWNDELYSQKQSVESLSFIDIFSGKVPEGNNTPLFYAIQKSICTLFNHKLPFEWDKEWAVAEPRSQLILRLSSIVFMSTSIVLMFSAFARRYSWKSGIYTLLLMMSSAMVWQHLVEARPYALWFLLSVIQILLFWDFYENIESRSKTLIKLTLCHILLSLTVVLSFIQIAVVLFIIFMIDKKNLTKLFAFTIPSVLCCVFYYLNAQHFKFLLPAEALTLITANLSVDLMLIIALTAIYSVTVNKNIFTQMKFDGAILSFIGLIFLSSLAFLGLFYLETSSTESAFEMNPRYFIYLIPIGCFTASWGAQELMAQTKNFWPRINLTIFLGGLLVWRILNEYNQLMNLRIFY